MAYVETRFALDWLARELAVTDGQSWAALELREHDRYRELARVAYDAVYATIDFETLDREAFRAGVEAVA